MAAPQLGAIWAQMARTLLLHQARRLANQEASGRQAPKPRARQPYSQPVCGRAVSVWGRRRIKPARKLDGYAADSKVKDKMNRQHGRDMNMVKAVRVIPTAR